MFVLAVAAAGGAGAAKPPARLPPYSAVPEALAGAFATVFGDGAADAWDMSTWRNPEQPAFSVAHDAVAGGPALRAHGPLTFRRLGSFDHAEIRCRVRFPSDAVNRHAALAVLIGVDPTDTARKPATLMVRASAKDESVVIAAAKPLATYRPRAYATIMPTWPDAMRLPLEADMASIPGLRDRWFELRCDRSGGEAAVWIDDRFVGRISDLPPGGGIGLQPAAGVAIAGARIEEVQPAQEPAPFVPLPLDGYARDRGFIDGVPLAADALPFGRLREIGGVPFRFVSRSGFGPDHIDLGRSLFRQANIEGYESNRGPQLGGAFTVDPARIQLSLPMDAYDELHLIAGFDGAADAVPLLTASFYRPQAGFHQVFETTLPGTDAAATAHAKPVPVVLENGRPANLWHVRIPLDPGRLSSFADLDAVELELAKGMAQYRTYPDPILYGWRPAGLPSGVHVYGLTLHRSPVTMAVEAAEFGHVWTAPAGPAYEVVLTNRTAAGRTVSFTSRTASHDGGDTWQEERTVVLPAGGVERIRFRPAARKHGWYAASFAVRDGDRVWTETRGFVRLAPDTRAPKWQEGKGALQGYWSYHGGHDTPPAPAIMRVMKAAGARAVVHVPRDAESRRLFEEWGWREGGWARAVSAPVRAWGDREPTAAEIADFKAAAIANIRKAQGDDPEVVTLFAEPSLSRDLTTGSPPEYWGEPPREPTAAERRSLVAFMRTSQAAAEAVRETWPKAKVLIPWGDPLFVVPLLRAGFPKHLIDGSGLDMIGFERLPEQQIHQMSTHRLHFLREEFRKFGMPDPALHFMEGVFVPTEPGACTWEEQADRYHRWTLLSLAYGVQRIYSGWFAFDCGDWYGAEHYGGCGIQRRRPYCDPKPAYAHYAAMTRLLDGATFDRWIPTGSHSVYCLRFKRPEGGPVLAVWTLRGRRPVTLATAATAVTVTDSMDNAKEVRTDDGRATVVVDGSPVYVTGVPDMPTITLGPPDHSDAVAESRRRNVATWQSGPVAVAGSPVHERLVARIGDGTWRFVSDRDEIYEGNNYDTSRYHAAMTARVVTDPGHDGPALAVHLDQPRPERKYMPWYARLVPKEPVPIPGRAAALGLRVKGASDWGRMVYCLRDARGERWLSVGRKDGWTCDDPHGWSSFCFDGWRFLRFELPGHTPYDSFREHGTTWWGSYGGDRIVDLPLAIEAIIVERRTHVMYVNDVQPADPADVLLGDLVAEYADEAAASDAAVVASRLRMPLPPPVPLANPIAEMAAAADPLPLVRLEKVTMPEWGSDGTRCHVHFIEVADAAGYQVWLSADPDGRGAVPVATMPRSGGLVSGLRPGMKLHLWVTYTTAGKPETARRSPPSNGLEIELVDEFGMK
jgi:hypothetical protein